MEINLRPKNILITGGGSGIGYAVAKRLLFANARVIVAGRNEEKLQHAVSKLNSECYGGFIKYLVFDVADVKSHTAKIDEAQQIFGSHHLLDGLVQCAGVFFHAGGWKGFNVSEEDYDQIMNTNLKGPFFLMRNVVNYMVKESIRGNVCNVASMVEWQDTVGPYEMSKLAFSRITKTYGKHLGDFGIILNGVSPGIVKSDMLPLPGITDGVEPGGQLVNASIKRAMRPEEIAESVFFLLTNVGETFSGSMILQTGGSKVMWIG